MFLCALVNWFKGFRTNNEKNGSGDRLLKSVWDFSKKNRCQKSRFSNGFVDNSINVP